MADSPLFSLAAVVDRRFGCWVRICVVLMAIVFIKIGFLVGFGIVCGGYLMWGWGLQEGDEEGLQHGDSGAEEGGQSACC